MKYRFDFLESVSTLKDTINNLIVDLERYNILTPDRHWLLVLLGTSGMWICIQYRFSRWIHYYFHIPVLRQILKVIFTVLQRVVEIVTGAEVPNRAYIGKGFVVTHTNGLVIHMDAQIGDYCNLSQQVTVGIGGRGVDKGTPRIGDRVFIGPGAKIFGPIHIGNNAAVGANAVVLKDVPDDAVVAGIPAKILSYKGSKDFVLIPKNIR